MRPGFSLFRVSDSFIDVPAWWTDYVGKPRSPTVQALPFAPKRTGKRSYIGMTPRKTNRVIADSAMTTIEKAKRIRSVVVHG